MSLAAQLDPILDHAIAATGGDLGNIQVLDREADALRILVQRGFEPSFLQYFGTVHRDGSSCAAALANRRRVLVGDVTISTLYTPAARRVMLAAGARACQSTPIVLDGQVVGVISTHFHQAHLPAPNQLEEVDELARRAGEVIGDAGAHPEQRARRMIDELHEASEKTRTIRRRTAS